MKQTYSKGLLKGIVMAGTISLLGMTASFAAVTLEADDNNTKVTNINGSEVKNSLFKPAQKVFTLEPGKHVITAKYDRMFKFRSGDHDYVKSGDVTVTVDTNDNQTYKLVWLNEPSSYDGIKDYIKNPTLAVMQGSQVVAQQTGTSNNSSGGLLSGLTGLFGGGSSNSQVNNQQAIAAINTPTQVNQPVQSAPVVYNQGNTSTLDSFMQLWLKATPEERAKIRQWVQE